MNTPLKTHMTLENPHFQIGNTSSNGGFSSVMLVFGSVYVNCLHHLREIEQNPLATDVARVGYHACCEMTQDAAPEPKKGAKATRMVTHGP